MDVLEYERRQVNIAYEAAEGRIKRLYGQLERGVPAVNNRAANVAADEIQEIIDGLEDAISPQAGLLLKGKLTFSDAASDELDGESYYVAIAALGVIDQPQVMSWESKLADAFRDPRSFRNGDEVSAKSIFVGSHRRLDMVQPVRVVGEGAGLPEDEALTAILKDRTGSDLSEVVSTIQRAQFELMELPPDESLVVQGGPGTGKTIIGLHRVSVLLYRYGDRIKPDDMLVVTPTDTLARYVRNVLPGLGRGSVRVVSMSGLERHGSGTPVPESADEQAALEAEQVKGLAVMYRVLRREVRSLVRVPPNGLTFGERSLTAEEVDAIIEEAPVDGESGYSELRRWVHERLTERLMLPEDADRSTITALLDQVAQDRSPRQLVAELLSSAKRLSSSADGLLTPAQQAAIKRHRTNVGDVPWSLADFALLDAADHLLNGPLHSRDRYSHIVVDEAQDLSPMQLKMLNRRLRSQGAFTILGDLAQATTGWADDSWVDHLEQGDIQIDENSVRPLTAGYRVPKVQMDFANQLLPVMDITTPATTSILDLDEPPNAVIAASDDDVTAQAIDHLTSLIAHRSDGESIGVIGQDSALDSLEVGLGVAGMPYQWADTSQDGHVTLVAADDAKGLEFDHVVVLRPELIYRADPVTGPRTLYVALTRSRRSLRLMHVDALPTALTGVTMREGGGALPAAAPAPPEAVPTTGIGEPRRWAHPYEGGIALVEWQIHGPASVSLLPSDGGGLVVLAGGFTAGSHADLQWALRRQDGSAVAVRTTAGDDATIAAEVVAAIASV